MGAAPLSLFYEGFEAIETPARTDGACRTGTRGGGAPQKRGHAVDLEGATGVRLLREAAHVSTDARGSTVWDRDEDSAPPRAYLPTQTTRNSCPWVRPELRRGTAWNFGRGLPVVSCAASPPRREPEMLCVFGLGCTWTERIYWMGS